MTRIKICCIASKEEAELAIRHGAAALGFVSAMPSGPGVLEESAIARILRDVPEEIDTFLLTSAVTVEEILRQHAACNTSTLQLVDHVSPAQHRTLRAALPGVRLVQVVHVLDETSVAEARRASETADALLVDSGNPTLPNKELGGTGRVHDWKLSARIVSEVSVPVYLAGGLDPANVRGAIDTVHPFGVDLCTGVRSQGSLDDGLLGRFMEAVRSR
jgi:phosphoribosylanthranilate isomerase